jgi:sphingolipid delta-4 desaturase
VATTEPVLAPGGFKPKLKLGMIGSAAPVFPGFEVDISDRIGDSEKPDAVWHRERARRMLRAHPEIKKLFGHAPSTAFWCIAVASSQLALAAAASHMPIWMFCLVAWVVGAYLDGCLFQLSHECTHCLVFKKASWNRALFTYTSLPMFLSGHHTWWIEHLNHHNDMGATKDFISRRRSFFLISRRTSPLWVPYAAIMLVMQVARSVVGLVMYVFGSLLRGRLQPGKWTLAALADEHLVSGYERDKITLWAVLYPLINLTVCGLLAAYGAWHGGWQAAWKPIVYLLLSQAFLTGWLHPLWLGFVLGISHVHGTSRYQPSASNYGWLVNKLVFNAGLHVEHHDLAGIPWFRLPQLRKIAPEFYDDLETIPSYTWLALQFVFCNQRFLDEKFNNQAHRNYARLAQREQAERESAEREPSESEVFSPADTDSEP